MPVLGEPLSGGRSLLGGACSSRGWDVAVCMLKRDRVSPVTFTSVVEQVPPTSNKIPLAFRLTEPRERHERGV
ncbi:uncharacterized [Tachysurus ichikawai]